MALDSALVFYNGIATTTIPIATGQDLQTILQNIDASINSHNTAPDYSGYNLYCITQTDGSTHPTNTQNFAEGISKIVCDNAATYTAFVGTTYVSDQAVLTAAINALQTPGLTYSHTAGGGTIAITSTMTRNQVLTATYQGVGTVLDLLGAPGTTWATLAVTTPTNISSAFNSLITYLSTLNTTVAGKEATLGTFDNSVNCLSGTATDSISTTVTLLTAYACALPVYDYSTITWYGVTEGVDLQTTVQSLVNTMSTILTTGVVAAGTGLIASAVGSTYQGTKLTIDTTYTQLYKVMVDSVDTTPDFLLSKLSAGTGITLSQLSPGGDDTIQITNSLPATSKVKVNSSDTAEDYLANKIPSTSDGVWGLALSSVASGDNSQLILTPTIGNPDLTFQAMMSYIISSPDLLVQFANLVAISGTVPGTSITNLLVTLTAGSFVYTWTAQTGNSQQAKWRIRGVALWSTARLTPADPLSGVAVTTTFASPPVNDPLQFQVDTIYGSGLVGSNIYENICFSCQTPSYTVVAGVIAINQTAVPYVDTITYYLYNSAVVLQQTIVTTGSSPAASFTAVGADTYSVTWVYGATVNGSTLYSNDPTQLNAVCTQANIVVP